MKPGVKICGMTNLKDALFCAQVGADMLGFIFYPKSSRYIDPKRAAEIIKHLPPSVKAVGVFVNEHRETIKRIIKATNIRIVQLSGDESADDCLGYDVEVWKAFRMREREEVKLLPRFNISAAMLDGAKDGEYGGSGILPDFLIAREMKQFHPLVLAGGLNTDNIVDAIQQVNPFAIDINSGVELAPGKKDHTKVKLLFDKLATLKT